jgi:hypothetical protein
MMEIPNKTRNPEAPKLRESEFRNIHPEDLSQYIKEAKIAVMEGLRQHLEKEDDASEWQSLAFSIGTLSELERIVDRWRAGSRRPR